MSVSDKAMLVNLSITTWSGQKLDKEATKEVADSHNALSGAGRYTKNIVTPEILEAAKKVASAARLRHYELTLPWSNTGGRILPSSLYFEYAKEMAEYKRTFNIGVDSVLAKLPSDIARAQYRLGTLFKSEDYPSDEQVKSKYTFEIMIIPFPITSDFRIELSDSETEELRLKIQNDISSTTEAAMKNAWTRIHDVVIKMSGRLSAYDTDADGAVVGKFHDTLITNARDLVDLLPHLNVVDDILLDKCKDELAELCKHDPKSLRDSKTLRTEVSNGAAAMAKTIGAMMGQ